MKMDNVLNNIMMDAIEDQKITNNMEINLY